MPGTAPLAAEAPRGSAVEVLRVALQLGLTSFGGPLAHLGYFERVYVRERRWLSAESYGALLSLCHVLPGPTSSQVGFLIGLQRAGWRGGLAAWAGFTLPSALLLYGAALAATRLQGRFALALLAGLKLVAVAVVAQAVWSMARRLCTDAATWLLAAAAAAALLWLGGSRAQLAVLGAAALVGALCCRPLAAGVAPAWRAQRAGWPALSVFALLLVGLALLAWLAPHSPVALAALFYDAGALVFGGGHVVLPLLRDALVPHGWISDDGFLGGYGLAQAMPGPLFAVAAYLGALALPAAAALGAAVALVCIFLPGLLLAVAAASLWQHLAHAARLRAALAGINAAVVGILAAALYDPLWTQGVHDGLDAAIAAGAFLVLQSRRGTPLAALTLCVGCSLLRALR